MGNAIKRRPPPRCSRVGLAMVWNKNVDRARCRVGEKRVRSYADGIIITTRDRVLFVVGTQ